MAFPWRRVALELVGILAFVVLIDWLTGYGVANVGNYFIALCIGIWRGWDLRSEAA